MDNNYTLVIIDGSFILTRAVYALVRDNKPEDVTPGDIMRLNLQTINRLSRDWDILGDKIIIVWDKWDSNLGGYIRTNLLKDHLKYKGSRKFIKEEDLEGLEGEVLEKAKRDIKINNLKLESKRAIIEEFPKIGIGCYYYPGYEFDDIATIASFELCGKTEKPNVIVTKDTDLTYSLSPGCNFFSLPTYGSLPKVITYEDMVKTVPESLRNSGVGLYQYGAMMNAAGFFGHNDMTITKKRGADPETTLLKLTGGDYSGIKDQEVYDLQYNSYNISEFPNYEDVKKDVSNFLKDGTFGNIENFRDILKRYSISDFDEDYYYNISYRFNKKLFSEK